jgi:hypothetical protein
LRQGEKVGAPGPATGMAMLRKGRAKRELAEAKNKRTEKKD